MSPTKSHIQEAQRIPSKINASSWAQWLMSIILATQEAEIWKIIV
jgi:hypothetical protein